MLLNFDETAIRFWNGGRRGYVLVPAGTQKNIFLEREERATASVRRSCCSLLTIIADCPLAQKLLPLILLVSEATVPQAVAAEITRRYATSEHCWLLRRNSAWLMLTYSFGY